MAFSARVTIIGSAPGAVGAGFAAGGGGGAARGATWGAVGVGASGAGDLVGPGDGCSEGPGTKFAGIGAGWETWEAIDGGALTGFGTGAGDAVTGESTDSIPREDTTAWGGIEAVADAIAGPVLGAVVADGGGGCDASPVVDV